MGPYQTDQVADFLTSLLTWLKANGPTYRIERWMLFTDYGHPEAWASTSSGG